MIVGSWALISLPENQAAAVCRRRQETEQEPEQRKRDAGRGRRRTMWPPPGLSPRSVTEFTFKPATGNIKEFALTENKGFYFLRNTFTSVYPSGWLCGSVVAGSCCDLRQHECKPHNRGLNNKCYDDCMCEEGEWRGRSCTRSRGHVGNFSLRSDVSELFHSYIKASQFIN